MPYLNFLFKGIFLKSVKIAYTKKAGGIYIIRVQNEGEFKIMTYSL